MVNERNGSKRTTHLKNGGCRIKLWVKGVKHVETVNPKSDELGTLSGE